VARPAPHHPRGFTLVELMIAATAAALLAGLTWPSLRDVLLRSRRADATAALARVQLAQERFRSAQGRYAERLDQLTASASRSADGHYALGLRSDGPDHYLASATATGWQSADTGCEQLTLRVEGAITEQLPSARCWLR
jgi:type IV pilus assembly protein PilE